MKTLLLLFSLFSFLFTNAQISKGSIWLGGSIQYSNSKNGEYNSKQQIFNFRPAVGFVVINNTVLGIQLNLNKSKYEPSAGEQSSSAYGADLFLRQYWEIVKRLYAYGHFRAGYSSTTDESKSANNSRETNGWTVGVGAAPGIAFSINKKFQLEAGFNDLFYFNYHKEKSDVVTGGVSSSYDNQSVSGGLNFDNASNLAVGVRFIIGK